MLVRESLSRMTAQTETAQLAGGRAGVHLGHVSDLDPALGHVSDLSCRWTLRAASSAEQKREQVLIRQKLKRSGHVGSLQSDMATFECANSLRSPTYHPSQSELASYTDSDTHTDLVRYRSYALEAKSSRRLLTSIASPPPGKQEGWESTSRNDA